MQIKQSQSFKTFAIFSAIKNLKADKLTFVVGTMLSWVIAIGPENNFKFHLKFLLGFVHKLHFNLREERGGKNQEGKG